MHAIANGSDMKGSVAAMNHIIGDDRKNMDYKMGMDDRPLKSFLDLSPRGDADSDTYSVITAAVNPDGTTPRYSRSDTIVAYDGNEFSSASFQISHEWINSSGAVGDEKGLVERIYIDWHLKDPRNPCNFSYRRKWTMTTIACLLTLISTYVSSAYAMGYPSMTSSLNCTEFEATIGLSLYTIGSGITPLFSSALSEEFGRQPLYLISTFVFLLTQLGIALAKNIQSVQLFRFIAGAAGSTGSTMVGGTVADIWNPEERGIPMSLFTLMAVGGTGLGPLVSGWIEMNPQLGWRWISWIQLIAIAVILIAIPIGMKESRSSVLLANHAKSLRKKTGDERYRARTEDTRPALGNIIRAACTRPIYLTMTEPVVISFSLWIGFAWGIVYSLVESVAPAFRELHNFNDGEAGTAFLGTIIGSLLGFVTNFYQEYLYHRNVKTRGDEARLYTACAAGIGFPIAMLIYALTSMPNVSWIGMVIGLVIFTWACFVIYLAVFNYMADCYGIYASSALAGQGLARNVAATAFPLFTTQMYEKLTFKWSSMLFGGIALLMAPIPFILFYYGPKIRARSKFTKLVPIFGQ